MEEEKEKEVHPGGVEAASGRGGVEAAFGRLASSAAGKPPQDRYRGTSLIRNSPTP